MDGDEKPYAPDREADSPGSTQGGPGHGEDSNPEPEGTSTGKVAESWPPPDVKTKPDEATETK